MFFGSILAANSKIQQFGLKSEKCEKTSGLGGLLEKGWDFNENLMWNGRPGVSKTKEKPGTNIFNKF